MRWEILISADGIFHDLPVNCNSIKTIINSLFHHFLLGCVLREAQPVRWFPSHQTGAWVLFLVSHELQPLSLISVLFTLKTLIWIDVHRIAQQSTIRHHARFGGTRTFPDFALIRRWVWLMSPGPVLRPLAVTSSLPLACPSVSFVITPSFRSGLAELIKKKHVMYIRWCVVNFVDTVVYMIVGHKGNIIHGSRCNIVLLLHS